MEAGGQFSAARGAGDLDGPDVDPIWERNLLSLGPSTTIIIKRTPQGGFIASDGLRAESAGFDSDAFPMFKDIDASLFYSKVSLSRMPSRDARR